MSSKDLARTAGMIFGQSTRRASAINDELLQRVRMMPDPSGNTYGSVLRGPLCLSVIFLWIEVLDVSLFAYTRDADNFS